MRHVFDQLPQWFNEVMERLVPEDGLREFPVSVRRGRKTRVTGLTKLVLEYGPDDSEMDALHHFAYTYGELLFKTNMLVLKWPRFVMAAAHFAFVLSIVHKYSGRDKAIIYMTDCLASDAHWSTLDEMGSGYEWYWLLAAIVLSEASAEFDIHSVLQKENWQRIKHLLENRPVRDWIARRELIERCVDKVIAETS